MSVPPVKTSARRRGVTLIEVLAILAIVIIFGALAGPSLMVMSGNSKQKGAADLIRSRIADARGRAIADGKPYRLAVQSDGTRIRVAPDGPNFTSPSSDPGDGTPMTFVVEDPLDKATASVDQVAGDDMMSTDSSGWKTIATFMPDGTCREATVTVTVHEDGFSPLLIHLRGLTGVTKTTTGNGGATP